MKTRILHTKIWQDDYFATLSAIEQHIFLHYLLNDAVNILHIYECPDRKALFESKVSPKERQNTLINIGRKDIDMIGKCQWSQKMVHYVRCADKLSSQ